PTPRVCLLLQRSPPSPRFPYTTLFRPPTASPTFAVMHWISLPDTRQNIRRSLRRKSLSRWQSSVDQQVRQQAELWSWITGLSSSDRKSTRLNSSHVKISYAVFCS